MTIITTTKTMRPRDAHDFYPTPLALASAALSHIHPGPHSYILDLGAGTGVWGGAARDAFPNSIIAGTDLRPLSRPNAYDYWQTGVDFLGSTPSPLFHAVIGNPPYKYAEAFVRLGWDYLVDGGYMCYLLRLAFLEGQDRGVGLWQSHRPSKVMICSRRPSFTGNGKTDATAYAVYVWQKASYGARYTDARLDWLQWDEPVEPSPQMSLFDALAQVAS